MKKSDLFTDDSVKKYYILSRPARLSDVSFEDIEADEPAAAWRDKSRQLQIRRWRKIRHQSA